MNIKRYMVKKQGIFIIIIILVFYINANSHGEQNDAYCELYRYHCADDIVYIDKYLGIEDILVMPDTIDGFQVSVINDNAFYGANVKQVTLPCYLRKIGKDAFAESALEGINCPDTLNTIGDGAFCLSCLHSIVIPESVSEIGDAAFASCYDLCNIEILAELEVLPEACFSEDTSLTNIILPDGIIEIGDNCFTDCYQLQEIILPETLKTIGHDAFSHCRSLVELELPYGCQTIGDACFIGCTNLKTVHIPSTLVDCTWWNEYLFMNCPNLELVIKNNPAFEQFAEKFKIAYSIY